ncbi:MAG: hypothetical protein KKA79_08025 [Nanoarchaeota archaeon]|nr:hypothetical protein [Nanoarchaeota archaeon]MCG2717897.1 hypothetical protein [Nanoarchaeota archaeon]
MDKKFAELVGIILGDGCIKNYPRHRALQISFNAVDDLDYLHYVAKLVQEIFQIKPFVKFRKTDNTADIFLFRKSVVDYLLRKGLKESPKWGRAKIPPTCLTKPFDKYVVRGLFDTDGCVALTKNNGSLYPRLELKICPSPMQEQVIDILNNYNFKFKVQKLDKGKIRIRLNGKEQLRKWRGIIGFSNLKHLKKSERVLKKE